jgi:DNA-binding XRE family transcriptional regulator
MIGTRSWKKRTEPLTTSRGSALRFFGDCLARRQASIPKRTPHGLSASAMATTGVSLLTLKAARRSLSATQIPVAAKIHAARRAWNPSESARPDATIASATPHAAQLGSAGR